MALALPIPRFRNPFERSIPQEHTVRVDVDRDAVAKGERSNVAGCPIALALRKSGYKGAYVTRTEIYLKGKGSKQVYTIPSDIRARILAYDLGMGMTPFSFEMKVSE